VVETAAAAYAAGAATADHAADAAAASAPDAAGKEGPPPALRCTEAGVGTGAQEEEQGEKEGTLRREACENDGGANFGREGRAGKEREREETREG